MKTILSSLLIFVPFFAFCQQGFEIADYTVKTDLLSHFRGNKSLNLELEKKIDRYNSLEFGVDLIYDRMFETKVGEVPIANYLSKEDMNWGLTFGWKHYNMRYVKSKFPSFYFARLSFHQYAVSSTSTSCVRMNDAENIGLVELPPCDPTSFILKEGKDQFKRLGLQVGVGKAYQWGRFQIEGSVALGVYRYFPTYSVESGPVQQVENPEIMERISERGNLAKDVKGETFLEPLLFSEPGIRSDLYGVGYQAQLKIGYRF